MSLPAKPARLCKSCRYDLLSIFENGFSGVRTTRRSRSLLPLRPRPTVARTSQNRNFATAQKKRQQNDISVDPLHRAVARENEAKSDAERGQTESQALDEIEKELGKPLEEAIREDTLAARDREFDIEAGAEDPSAEFVVEDTIDQVQALRDASATIEEVVRKARSAFGEYLPDGTLDQHETKLYIRLYGEPVAMDEDVAEVDSKQPLLFNADGKQLQEGIEDEEFQQIDTTGDEDIESSRSKNSFTPFSDEAIARAHEIAKQLGGEVYQPAEYRSEENEDFDEDETPDEKSHPLTAIGKFATSPRTVFLNQESYIQPLTDLLGNYSNKQLKEMCEKTFGGPGLPDSALTPRSAKGRKSVAIPIDPSQHVMGEMEANAYFSTVMPPTYAAITSILTETRKRLGSTWLRGLLAKPGGPRVLDAGAGGAGILAWRDIVNAEWQSLHFGDEEAPEPPRSKAVVLAGSDTIRHRSAALLENTTFIPRLPDYVHTRDGPTIDDERPLQARKEFDVIIAPHTLFPLKEDWQRKQHIQNLWSLLSSNGGVLIVLEKGVHRGFEAVAGARDLLLTRYISSPGSETYQSELQSTLSQEEQITEKEPGMIIAPCTNHSKCPMYAVQGVARGRRDMCSFQQRYIRPGFLQQILGATDRNHDEVDFSYISVMKGRDIRNVQPQSYDEVRDPWNLSASTPMTPSEDFPLANSLPRIVYPPLKRRGHVTIDLCTSAGKIERWTVPKSFSKQAYRDARKSRWGDLWALDAKTKNKRNLQLGTKTDKEQMIKDRLADEAAELREQEEEAALNEIAYAEIESEDVVLRPRKVQSAQPQPTKKNVRANTRSVAGSHVKSQNQDDPQAINAFLEEWEHDFQAVAKKLPGRKGTKASESSRAAKKLAKMQRASVQPDLTLPWMRGERASGEKRRVEREVRE